MIGSRSVHFLTPALLAPILLICYDLLGSPNRLLFENGGDKTEEHTEENEHAHMIRPVVVETKNPASRSGMLIVLDGHRYALSRKGEGLTKLVGIEKTDGEVCVCLLDQAQARDRLNERSSEHDGPKTHSSLRPVPPLQVS